MLGNYDVHADIGVKDLEVARKFYEGTLGLTVDMANEWEVYYTSGNSKVKIYMTDNAGTNKSTYCSWDVDDVAECVEELKAKGVTFEHYDMPNVTREGDVHVMGDTRAAWFKDPDGNILCVANHG